MVSTERLNTVVRTHIHKETTMLLNFIKNWFKPTTYSSELESYIINHNPQNGGDIERLTRQYDNHISQGKLL